MSASESIKHCFVDLGSAKKGGSWKIGVWVSLKKRFLVFPDLKKSLFSTLFVDYEQMDETDHSPVFPRFAVVVVLISGFESLLSKNVCMSSVFEINHL